LRPEAHWPHLLRAGRVEVVVREALLRLRMARREPLVCGAGDARGLAAGLEGRVVAAALLVPIGAGAAARLLEWVTAGPGEGGGPETESTTTEEDDHDSHGE
jgi:hypothetical protein